MTHSVLELIDLHRRFGAQAVLRGLTLRVEPGQVYALLGRNGAGKTTAMRCLLGFLRPHRGTAGVLGHDSEELPPEVRARTGYVSEEHRLYPYRTVARTLEFEAGTNPRIDLAQVTDRVHALGLPPRRRVRNLSRGQRAQLALTITLAAAPEALVFDDPALGLDAVVRRELLDRVIDGIGSGDVGMLLSTHDLPSAERLADRIGILHEGRIAWERDVDEMKRDVRRWFLRGPGAALEGLPGVLAARATGEGVEVVTDAVDPERLSAAAREAGAALSEPVGATLEDVFVAVTSQGASSEAATPRQTVEV